MKSLVLLLLGGMFLLISCDEYIENKRAGLRPYHGDDETREAQEENKSE